MRYLFISNRLPYSLSIHNSEISSKPSSGGLASALASYVSTLQTKNAQTEYVWVGWPGTEVLPEQQSQVTHESLEKHHALPIFLSQKEIDYYYNGFCNKTLWPLFHYFPAFTCLQEEYWNMYVHVNTVFAQRLHSIIRPDDHILIQDYHLMLLPQILRSLGHNNKIGFFLHIPFPTGEIFNILHLPWQRKLLSGLLGANLIGFHTVAYQMNFLNAVTKTLGYSAELGSFETETHRVRTGVFPIGVDYAMFNSSAHKKSVTKLKSAIKHTYPKRKIIISVDRLDYSKEIFNRLKGYEYFLQQNPAWHNKIIFNLTLVPSRSDVDTYQQTKNAIISLINDINAVYSADGWNPVDYQYSSISSEELIALYTAADIALITPARDGMNLVAKEFVSSRTDKDGVLILSKLAGASDELTGAILVNPYYPSSIAQGILHALTLSKDERKIRMEIMQNVLQKNTVFDWARVFSQALDTSSFKEITHSSSNRKFFSEYEHAKKRLLLFDYDGTLVPLAPTPDKAKPTSELITIMYQLAQDPKNNIAVVSGRDKDTLDDWLGWLPISLSAEHGAWIKNKNHMWKLTHPLSNSWKDSVREFLNHFTVGLPGSFLEEKDYSLAFHYRLSPQKLAEQRIHQLAVELQTFLANSPLQVMRGNKVLEIKYSTVDKGIAAYHFLNAADYDFILAAGDDITDEDLFSALPDYAYAIKVGDKESKAQFRLNHPDRLLKLLEITSLKSTYYNQQFIAH